MDRVRDVEALGDSWTIMVLIGELEPGQRHIGIGYRTPETNEVRFLHLAWHYHLKNDATSPDFFTYCVGPRLPDNRLRQVSAHCRRVWRANEKGGIPYAFSSPRDSLDPATGAFLLGPTRFGLTCASFILAVFESAGVSLLAYDAWPSDRAGDVEWRESIIKRLELERGISQAHVTSVRSEMRAVRYRPEEVAAGAAIAPPPADFESASALGREIVALLRNRPAAGTAAGSSPAV